MGVMLDNLRTLLDLGAEPNLRDFNGETPLHYAVKQGSAEYVNTLIAYDADLYLENNSGYSPLILGFDAGRDVALKILMGKY